jgi:predicted component of type VI protein secretion system
MRQHCKWVWLVVLSVALVGCQKTKLNHETTFDLPVGQDNTITVDAIKNDQKIKVDLSSPAAPVSVYVCLEKDAEEVRRAIVQNKASSDKILMKQEKTQAVILEPTIPGGNGAVILVYAGTKNAKVTVKITN